ncbi:hypothetical protein PR002_g18051 [Phytophthora rubi]|uniref:Uncharacterized protein n=1 Tax=Phytophthora rubi TaxID=129364 RepID=A0A6A3K097_9STRA|nr:hypothetical protein PR002_g18051 [Phytophthora rubi]
MALHRYPDAVGSLTMTLKCVHAPTPESTDNQQETLAEDEAEPLPAIAGLHHVVPCYPIQHDSAAVKTLELKSEKLNKSPAPLLTLRCFVPSISSLGQGLLVGPKSLTFTLKLSPPPQEKQESGRKQDLHLRYQTFTTGGTLSTQLRSSHRGATS